VTRREQGPTHGRRRLYAGGNGIQLNGDLINLSTNLQTVALPLSYSAVRNFNTSAGDITISGAMTAALARSC